MSCEESTVPAETSASPPEVRKGTDFSSLTKLIESLQGLTQIIKNIDQLREPSEKTASARSELPAIIANEDPASEKVEQMISHLNQVNL